MSTGGSWKDLFLAAEQGDIPKARYHLGLGVDPNFQHPEYFSAPLFEAIKHGHFEMVKILIEEGMADPSLVEELTDDSALDIALSCREFEILDYLNTHLPPGERWSPHHVLVTTIGTGRNLEIGKEICRRFLGKGHRVVLVCSASNNHGHDHDHDRNHSIPDGKSLVSAVNDSIQEELRLQTKNPHIDCIVGDLETVTGVRALAGKIRERIPLLNTLIHNAAAAAKEVWATEPIINEDGLEISFMVNFMARNILTSELMPVLRKSLHPRILCFLPDHSSPTVSTPGPNATIFGKDFHWYRTVSGTTAAVAAGYHSLSFLTAVRAASDGSVAVSMVKTGRLANPSPPEPSPALIWLLSCLLSWIFRFLNPVLCIADNPVNLVTATEPFLLAETGEIKRLHGRILHARSGLTTESISPGTRSVLLGRARPEEWEQWTADFLSSRQTAAGSKSY